MLARVLPMLLIAVVNSNALAGGEWRIGRSDDAEFRLMPRLEVKLLSGDFERWGFEKVIYSPELLQLRWGQPLAASTAAWEIADSPFPDGTIIGTGAIPEAAATGAWRYFTIPLTEVLAATPPQQGAHEYYLRVVPTRSGSVATTSVKLIYKRDESSTRFTAAGLYPELFRPMPVFVDLHTFRLIKADEEDDEEPYIIPVVIYFDGTTIDIWNFSTSSARLETATRSDTHGNIPQYGSSIGSGDNITIPGEVGYFEEDILPINIELADDAFMDEVLGLSVDYTHLTRATTIWVGVLALEEDVTSTEAANAARDAFIDGLRHELNACIQSMTLPDALRMIENGQDLDAILTADEGELCGYTATEDTSILDQIRSKLKSMAKDAATGEELDDALNWLPGGITNLIDNAADHDDVIGFQYRSFTYDQLWSAKSPISFTLDLHLLEGPSYPQAGMTNVHYQIDGKIGRCTRAPGEQQCRPVVQPAWARRR